MRGFRCLKWALAASLLCSAAGAWAASANLDGVWVRYPDPYPPGPFAMDPPPPGGAPHLREPYAREYEAYLKHKAALIAQGRQVLDASSECLPEGMPTVMGAVLPIQILQTSNEIVVLAENLAQTRRIFLDQHMPPPDEITPSYDGYSVGHWKGDTLVVQTRGVRKDATFINMPHSRGMVITERIRRTAPDRLEDRVTIEDPSVLTRPYEFTYGYKLKPHYKIQEYICTDNRYARGPDGTIDLQVAPN